MLRVFSRQDVAVRVLCIVNATWTVGFRSVACACLLVCLLACSLTCLSVLLCYSVSGDSCFVQCTDELCLRKDTVWLPISIVQPSE